MVVLSLAVLLPLMAFEGGLQATPGDTKDSKGFVYGFNNRITPELYGIIFRNTSMTATIKAVGVIGVLTFAAEIIGLGVILGTSRHAASRLRESYFVSQMIFFIPAAIGGFFGSLILRDVVKGVADGETFTDGLPVWWLAHSFWFCASLTVYILSRLSRRVRQN